MGTMAQAMAVLLPKQRCFFDLRKRRVARNIEKCYSIPEIKRTMKGERRDNILYIKGVLQ